MSLIIEELQKQVSTNLKTIVETKKRIDECETLAKSGNFDSVLMYFLREKLGFNYQEQKNNLKQAVSNGYTEISRLEQENALLDVKINSLQRTQQCEAAKVTFQGQGIVQQEGVKATFKCQGCGTEFTRDLSQIRDLDRTDRLQRVLGCRDEIEYQKECVNPGMNVLQVTCPKCSRPHYILIHREF